MRKETRKIVTAFVKGEPATAARTTTDGQAIFLHGNKVFWKGERPGQFFFSMCGWGTVTTRDRINAALYAVGLTRCGVFQKDHDQKYRDEDGLVWDLDPRDTIEVNA